MRGWLPGRVLSGSLNGSGPAGAAPGGRLGGRPCLVGLFSRVGLVVWCWHERHARCGGLLGLLWSWWSAGGGCPRVPLVCGGGMLSGFWGSAPWLPDPSGLLICCWGLWVGVGGLVVNCIVDASILL